MVVELRLVWMITAHNIENILRVHWSDSAKYTHKQDHVQNGQARMVNKLACVC